MKKGGQTGLEEGICDGQWGGDFGCARMED